VKYLLAAQSVRRQPELNRSPILRPLLHPRHAVVAQAIRAKGRRTISILPQWTPQSPGRSCKGQDMWGRWAQVRRLNAIMRACTVHQNPSSGESQANPTIGKALKAGYDLLEARYNRCRLPAIRARNIFRSAQNVARPSTPCSPS